MANIVVQQPPRRHERRYGRHLVDLIRGAGPVLLGGVSPGPAVRPGAAAARCTA
jgi:hypothetical protein